MTARAQLIPAGLSAVLDEIDDYLSDRADSEDGSYGIPEANLEMRLLTDLRAATLVGEGQLRELVGAADTVNAIARTYHDAEDAVTYETRYAIARLDAAIAKVDETL